MLLSGIYLAACDESSPGSGIRELRDGKLKPRRVLLTITGAEGQSVAAASMKLTFCDRDMAMVGLEVHACCVVLESGCDVEACYAML